MGKKSKVNVDISTSSDDCDTNTPALTAAKAKTGILKRAVTTPKETPAVKKEPLPRPSDFTKIDTAKSSLYMSNLKDPNKEYFVVRAPPNFTLKTWTGFNSRKLKVKTNKSNEFTIGDKGFDCKCTTPVADKTMMLVLPKSPDSAGLTSVSAGEFRQLIVTPSSSRLEAKITAIKPAPRMKPPAIPPGLWQRYVPFGAGREVAVEKRKKKHKDRSSKKLKC